MTKNILKIFLEKGFLLDKEMLDFLSELKDEEIANEIINKIAIISKQKLITKNLVNQNIEKLRPIFFDLDSEKKKLIERFFVNVSISVEVHKETIYEPIVEDKKEMKNPPVKIISSPIVSSKTAATGKQNNPTIIDAVPTTHLPTAPFLCARTKSMSENKMVSFPIEIRLSPSKRKLSKRYFIFLFVIK